MSAHSTNVRRYGDIICTLPYPGNHRHIGSHWPSLLLSTTAQYSWSVGETLLKHLVKSPALVHSGSRFCVTVANLSPFHTFHSVKCILRSCLLYHYFLKLPTVMLGILKPSVPGTCGKAGLPSFQSWYRCRPPKTS